ncbi:MAG: hypothetical protein ACLFSU_05840 [Acholeplasmataceae bacterium]
MDLNPLHIELVTYELMRLDREGERTDVAFMEETDRDYLYRRYALHREEHPNYDTIIGAYYINSEWFYYIERFDGDLFLARRTELGENRVRLSKEEIADYHLEDDELLHFAICAICYEIDFKQLRL